MNMQERSQRDSVPNFGGHELPPQIVTPQYTHRGNQSQRNEDPSQKAVGSQRASKPRLAKERNPFSVHQPLADQQKLQFNNLMKRVNHQQQEGEDFLQSARFEWLSGSRGRDRGLVVKDHKALANYTNKPMGEP